MGRAELAATAHRHAGTRRARGRPERGWLHPSREPAEPPGRRLRARRRLRRGRAAGRASAGGDLAGVDSIGPAASPLGCAGPSAWRPWRCSSSESPLASGCGEPTPTGVSSGGSNWSDLGVHLSIAETLNAGANFPPEVPYFAGEPLVYHWFADFHAAILAEAAGLFSIPAMVVAVDGAGRSARPPRLQPRAPPRPAPRRRACRNAGRDARRLRRRHGIRPLRPRPGRRRRRRRWISSRANSYDNQWLTGWPYFRIPSVMGTGLLAHRATTAGLPILVGAILLLVAGLPTARQRAAGWRDRPAVIALAGAARRPARAVPLLLLPGGAAARRSPGS